ncbi:MFS multidrug transporter [Teratosphaeria destructans]|uniref:MFS multidrug transporter n=1 Tax=Teratosphaeria destructans TaxID=418781 RepID=A0A9W7W2H4_9PEZI|nr:MFS multidrug transporter [Teratosphaeria destructans]
MDIHNTEEEKVPATLATPAGLLAAQLWRGIVVDEPGNRQHPRNWDLTRKIYDTGMIMFIEFFTTVISTASANAGYAASKQLGLGHSVEVLLFMTLVLAAPSYRHTPNHSVASGSKRAFSVLIAAWPTSPGIALGRFATGFVPAVPSVVNLRQPRGYLEHSRTDLGLLHRGYDLQYGLSRRTDYQSVYHRRLRLRVDFFSSQPSFVGSRLCFYDSCASRGRRPLSVALLNSYERSLARMAMSSLQAAQMISQTSAPLCTLALVNRYDCSSRSGSRSVAVLAGVAIALVYLFAEIMPTIFQAYDPPLSQIEKVVRWLCLAAGFLLGCITRVCDHMRLHDRCTRDIQPGDKLLGFVLAAPSLAVGLWWFAWTVPPSAASGLIWSILWPVAAVSLVPVGWALNEFDAVLGGYITDTYRAYAASAFGAMNLRDFPTAGDGRTLLAACATVFCIVPVVFVRHGARIRKRSKCAMWSADASKVDSVER